MLVQAVLLVLAMMAIVLFEFGVMMRVKEELLWGWGQLAREVLDGTVVLLVQPAKRGAGVGRSGGMVAGLDAGVATVEAAVW